MVFRRAALFLLLVYSARADYTINVYREMKNVAVDNIGRVEGLLEVGHDYSLEIKSTDLSVDYLLQSCTVVETGEQIIGPPGCLKCTPVFINMVESAGYNYGNAAMKASIIHFRPNRPDMSFQCTLQIYPKGSMERACERGLGALGTVGAPLDTIYLYWSTGGLPWWVWLLIILLILLLLCCCLGLLAALLFRWRKKKAATAVVAEKKTVIAHTDVKPYTVPSGTQTSNFDKTSVNRLALESGSGEMLTERAGSKQSNIEAARVVTVGDEKVEVFSGHAGVYNVRNGTAAQHRYEKNPAITRTRHESEHFEEANRHTYFNGAYEPETTRRNVNCVEGFDEVIRYTTDREIGEYDHIEREIETNHTTRFYNEPTQSQPPYYDRRHNSIPV